ncbi:MAG: hypothetical protein KC964_09840, partial [Candidatus Omnitrophica bacterium]|nr:hypothetical protein [Candidatus Omnitrophota bacterium]
DSYLEYTRYYQQKMDLRVAYMSNWDDDFWWQEMEVPGFYESLCEHLPDSIGFGRGMGESPFEPSFFDGCAPYIFCGEGLHSDSDVYQTIVDFVEANTIRPLFIFLLTNHNTKLATIHDALDRLPNKSDYELVRLDKFFHLLTKAREEGLIGDDLYPEKEGLRDMLAQEAKAGWEKLVSAVAEHGDRANLTKVEFTSQVTDPMTRLILDRSATPANDIVMWDTVWDSMKLVKSALNMKGVYVNEKRKGVQDFVRQFGDLPDAAVIQEIWTIWEDWEENQVRYEEACLYAKRLAGLAEALDNNLN